MPASVDRQEYYYENGRLIERSNRRQSIYSQWPRLDQAGDLVVSIEDQSTSRKITLGPMATPARIAHSLIRYHRRSEDQDSVDIGPSVPKGLVDTVSAAVRDAIRHITGLYRRLVNEERKTGGLTSEFSKFSVFEEDGWEATVVIEGFSPQLKEPIIGADFGIVVDVRSKTHHVTKALLIQAKQSDVEISDPFDLPDMKEQFEKMSKITKESYACVYTPNGINVFQGISRSSAIGLDDLLGDTVMCKRGDRSRYTVAQALEDRFVIEIQFAGPGFTGDDETILIRKGR